MCVRCDGLGPRPVRKSFVCDDAAPKTSRRRFLKASAGAAAASAEADAGQIYTGPWDTSDGKVLFRWNPGTNPDEYVSIAVRFLGPVDPADPFRGLGKVAALGIKVTRHCTYHGVALNVDMDLAPYGRINPCGYNGLKTVDLASLGVHVSWDEAAGRFVQHLDSFLAP